jgi:hypothetical protein
VAEAKKRIPMVVVLLPIVAVLGIAAAVGWNLWRDYQKSEAEDEESRRIAAEGQADARQRNRPAPVEAVVDAGTPEDDELAKLPPGQKRPPTVRAPVGQTAAQKSYYSFKAAYDRLEAANETTAKKFRARRLVLEDQFGNGKPANEAKFVAECDAVKAQILEALRNPENQ